MRPPGTKIKERHCPRCNTMLAAHVTQTLFGDESEYVELCPNPKCRWGRRARLKLADDEPMRDPNAGRANG